MTVAPFRWVAPRRLGRYELLSEIASGGMARVYLGRLSGEGGFERAVAIKVLHPHLAEEPEFVAMLLDEARVCSSLRHANLVDVLDVGRDGNVVFLVMDFVEGGSLHALARAARAAGEHLPASLSLRVVHDALLGLHAAHEVKDARGEPLGVVHRDVSPQNLLVGVDGVARVTDFGIAKAKNRLASTQDGVVKGKFRYLAPEQVRCEEIDRRTDVFAAGIVLWELLTEKRLFNGAADQELMRELLFKEVPPPTAEGAESTLALDRVVLRALERDPAKRFATAIELAEALEAAARETMASRREVGERVERLLGTFLAPLREALRRPADADDATPGAIVGGAKALDERTTSVERVQDSAGVGAQSGATGERLVGRRRWPPLVGGGVAVTLAVGVVMAFARGGSADAPSPAGSAFAATPAIERPAAAPTTSAEASDAPPSAEPPPSAASGSSPAQNSRGGARSPRKPAGARQPRAGAPGPQPVYRPERL